MDKKSIDWKEEVDYLECVKGVFGRKIKKLDDDVLKSKQTVESLRQYYVDGTQIFGELDNAERVTVNQIINENVELANNNIDKASALRKNLSRPYFGRVDFVEKSSKDYFKAYIGLTGVDENNNYYVIDWRAPIAELFYDYGKGKAKYSIPDGKIEGEVTLKRQYDIVEGNLEDVYDVDGDLFDEYLQKVLSKINEGNLHNIAGTIQKEQNEIIRDLKDDLVVVQGYSGSGKTTVALHRIAYAMYRLKDLKSANILLFTLNEAFMSHIEGVLPELGEQNTRSATLAKFVGRLLKLSTKVEEMDAFLVRFTKLSEKEKEAVNFKLSFEMRDKIFQWAKDFCASRKATTGFKVESKGISLETLNASFEKVDGNKIFAKLNLIALAIAKKLKVDRFDFAKRMIREKVYECFDVPNNLIDLYKRMCKDFGVECKIDGNLYMEDAVLLCILRECVSEMAIKMDIRHIVIDEVQEYPILFIDFLLRNFGRAQFSMFGDKYQRTNPVGIDDLEQIVKLNAIWGDSKLYTLDNTYRSSEEIVEYSSKIIGSPRHNVFRYSNGQDVEEVLMGDDVCQVVSQVAMILEKIIGNKGTIGIIVGDDEFGQEFYNELSKICPHRVSFIKNAEDEACGQVQILPVILSKGLEFDTVIVIENGGLFNSELGTNLRYIACTRAINKLYVLKHKD